jgi:glutathione S-transferase
MILIGQYDSPFVRRVAIAMSLYGIAFEHRPWSVFSDAGKISALNPLMRVPVLVTDEGQALVETFAILDHLDRMAGSDRALFPVAGVQRMAAMRIAALASGISDKAVALFYEKVLHVTPSQTYVARCEAQISETLALLEAERGALASSWWFGDTPGHADIAVAAMLRHVREAHPGLADAGAFPALDAHCDACEALSVFREISQPFAAPV